MTAWRGPASSFVVETRGRELMRQRRRDRRWRRRVRRRGGDPTSIAEQVNRLQRLMGSKEIGWR